MIETAVDASRPRDTVRILDTGPGVREAELPDVFTPFCRGGAVLSGGYGLGLAIARRSVETHRGTITAVTVELPMAASVG